MNCRYCNSSWISDVQPDKCPFCGKNLYSENLKFYEIQPVIDFIISNYGKEAYSSGKRFISILSDYSFGLESEKRLLKICFDSGVITSILAADSLSMTEREYELQKAVSQLEEQFFIKQEIAYKALKWITSSLGWKKSDSCKSFNDEHSSNSESINNNSNKSIIHTVKNTRESIPSKIQKSLSSDEISFEQALEESLKSLNSDQKVVGTVLHITPTAIQVDIGRKQTGIIPKEEFSADPTVEPEKCVSIGDQLNLIIMKSNDSDNFITLSKKRYDAQVNWDIIASAKDSNAVLEGNVTEILSRGVIVLFNGIRVFIPASQATLSKNDRLENLLGTKVSFKVIDVENGKRRAVGSIVDVSIKNIGNENKKIALTYKKIEDSPWEVLRKEYSIGTITDATIVSLNSFGAFAQLFPRMKGLIHYSQISDKGIVDPSDVLAIGDVVRVKIIDIDFEKKHLSLSIKAAKD